MKFKLLHFLILVSLAATVFAAVPHQRNDLGSVSAPLLLPIKLNNSTLFNLPAGLNNSTLPSLAELVQNASYANSTAFSNLSMLPDIFGFGAMPSIPKAIKMPSLEAVQKQLQLVLVIAVILFYIFAAGRIADTLQSSGKKITKQEMIEAPIAYVLFAFLGVLFYVSSNAWVPPQSTFITFTVYLLLIPLGISIIAGAAALYGFFHDRLGLLQSLDLSAKIALAPIFDGLRGYWTALGAAAILSLVSAIAAFSSGGNSESLNFDFFLLSSLVAIYYAYRTATSTSNEKKASNAVTALVLVAPGILRLFFKQLVCTLLSLVPFSLFSTCPLDTAGSGAALAVSIGATLLLLVPLVPIIYALVVNLLRAATFAGVLLKKEPKDETAGGSEQAEKSKTKAG